MDVPESALNNLMECLLISFEFVVEKREFRFVSDYPYRSPHSMREFIGFVFHGVTDFHRKLGDQVRFYRYKDSYRIEAKGGGVVVQHIKQNSTDEGKRRLELWFGSSFGGVSFRYLTIDGFTRGSRAEKLDDDYVYSDAKTGEKFNFYEPFPTLTT